VEIVSEARIKRSKSFSYYYGVPKQEPGNEVILALPPHDLQRRQRKNSLHPTTGRELLI
jgi:hypothetical protein